jgi:hypothetical protein
MGPNYKLSQKINNIRTLPFNEVFVINDKILKIYTNTMPKNIKVKRRKKN